MEAPISVDLETAKIKYARPPLEGESEDDLPLDPLDVPQPALGMACDANSLYLIHPDKFATFIQKHRYTHWVFHNAAFDWWVLHRYSCGRLVREQLWGLAEEGRLHDSMLMDMLLQLATGQFRRFGSGGDQKLYPTNLGVLATEWGVGELDKDDPFRTKFGDLIGLSEEEIEAHPNFESFATYALKDVLACYGVFPKQRAKGLELMRKAGWSPTAKAPYEMRPDCVERFGVLSERVQVAAAIVLAELGRTPIRIDLQRRQQLEDAARKRHQIHLNSLVGRAPDLIRMTKAKYKTVTEGKGKNKTKTKVLVKAPEVVFTKKAGVPSFNSAVLGAVLREEADRLNVDPPVSDGKERRMSLSTKQWKHLSEESAFIKSWVALEDEGKLIEDLCKINAPQVYSKYDLLKVTGRTGSGQYADGRTGRQIIPSLNIQNVQRDNPDAPDESMRALFLAPEGCKWAAIDYSYIEIRAMAAVARAMIGESKMAEVTINHTKGVGADPHQVTAASVMGIPVEEFLKLDKATQKKRRQEAKVANFGFMGGMGCATMCNYAAAQGVNLTLERSQEVKRAWKSAYPEMNKYLEGTVYEGLMWGTDKKSGPKLKPNQQYRLSEFLKTTNGEDPEYDAEAESDPLSWTERQQFWQVLEWAAKWKGDEQTKEDVRLRRVTQRVRKLTYYRAASLTGRIRNHCAYTEQKNVRFQSISADGAKMAMFRLMRLSESKGWTLLNFVHDEIGLSIPANKPQLVKEAERIMIEEMEKVLGHGIPVAVESEVADCWSKA